MRRVTRFAFTLLTLSVLIWSSSRSAAADGVKTVRGLVSAIGPNSLTLVNAPDMTFNVDSRTEVVARGAGTRARKAKSQGLKGPTLSEIVQSGSAVEVTYHETNGGYYAGRVKVIPGESLMLTPNRKPTARSATGLVQWLSADSIAISGSNGQAMTFRVDTDTRVVGPGIGKKTAAKGGKTGLTDVVSSGDKVSVTYHESGESMYAATVRVISLPTSYR